MSRRYRMFDNFFDLESLDNLYLDSHYFVARHRIEIFYLVAVNHVNDLTSRLQALVRHRIFKRLPELLLSFRPFLFTALIVFCLSAALRGG